MRRHNTYTPKPLDPRPLPKGGGPDPDDKSGSTAEQRNRALHEAAQAVARRSQLTRIERRIAALLTLLREGDSKEQLEQLEQWKADCEADMRAKGQTP